jgi:hypothetical protein
MSAFLIRLKSVIIFDRAYKRHAVHEASLPSPLHGFPVCFKSFPDKLQSSTRYLLENLLKRNQQTSHIFPGRKPVVDSDVPWRLGVGGSAHLQLKILIGQGVWQNHTVCRTAVADLFLGVRRIEGDTRRAGHGLPVHPPAYEAVRRGLHPKDFTRNVMNGHHGGDACGDGAKGEFVAPMGADHIRLIQIEPVGNVLTLVFESIPRPFSRTIAPDRQGKTFSPKYRQPIARMRGIQRRQRHLVSAIQPGPYQVITGVPPRPLGSKQGAISRSAANAAGEHGPATPMCNSVMRLMPVGRFSAMAPAS